MTKRHCAGALATGSPTSLLGKIEAAEIAAAEILKEAGHIETTAV